MNLKFLSLSLPFLFIFFFPSDHNSKKIILKPISVQISWETVQTHPESYPDYMEINYRKAILDKINKKVRYFCHYDEHDYQIIYHYQPKKKGVDLYIKRKGTEDEDAFKIIAQKKENGNIDYTVLYGKELFGFEGSAPPQSRTYLKMKNSTLKYKPEYTILQHLPHEIKSISPNTLFGYVAKEDGRPMGNFFKWMPLLWKPIKAERIEINKELDWPLDEDENPIYPSGFTEPTIITYHCDKDCPIDYTNPGYCEGDYCGAICCCGGCNDRERKAHERIDLMEIGTKIRKDEDLEAEEDVQTIKGGE